MTTGSGADGSGSSAMAAGRQAPPSEAGAQPFARAHRGLTPGTRKIARQVALAALPAGGRLPAPGEPLMDELDRFLTLAPWHVALGYRLLLRLFDLGAILFHLRPFRYLRPDAARRYMGRWHKARIFWLRVALRGLLTPLKLAHFSDPAVERLLGYDPPPPPAPAPPARWEENLERGADRAGETIDCDVVIVGSGPGGAVMATRLAEQGLAVVVLEEGRLHRRSEFNRRPYEMTKRLYRELGLTVAYGVPGIPIPLGRTVGGTSTINSGTCFRVPDRILAEWRETYGLSAYTPDALAPHFDELETFLAVGPADREVQGKVAELVGRGAGRLGWSHGPLRRNALGCQGSGVCAFGCPAGAKQSMNVSYVPRALRAGARVFTGARAERILRQSGRAAGLVAQTEGGGRLTVRASAVVISAGALLTPNLLRKNGIGRRSGALGNNLTIHPATKVAALFDEPVRQWDGIPQGYCVDQFAEEGILFEGASVAPGYGAIGFPQFGPAFVRIMEQYEHVAFFGFLVEDETRGKVRPGPGGSPLIRYSAGPAELRRLKRGTELLSQLFFEAGARLVMPPIAGLEVIEDPADLFRLRDPSVKVRDFELSAFHPLGTCRMGVSPSGSVLDPGLETWDLDGLFVADGSVFPTSLGVNPQMTIMAVSSRAAEHVAARVGGATRLMGGRSGLLRP